MSSKANAVIVFLLLACLGAPLRGQTFVKLGSQTVDAKVLDGTTYVTLEDFATALGLEYEYAFVTGAYTLMGSADPEGAPLTVKFRVGSTDVTVNGAPRSIPRPALDRDAHVFLPVEAFLPLFLEPADGGSTSDAPPSSLSPVLPTSAPLALNTVTASHDGHANRIELRFDGHPTWHLRPGENERVVDLVLADARSDLPLGPHPTPPGSGLALALERDGATALRLRITAPTRPEIRSSFDEVSRILRLAIPDALIGAADREVIREATEAQRTFFQKKLVVISESPSHAPVTPRTLNRQRLVHDQALALAKMLEDTGFRVTIVGPEEDTLSTRDHVSRINELRPDLVLCIASSPATSLHTRGRFVLFTLPVEGADPHGLYGPTLAEANRASSLSRRLGETLRRVRGSSVLTISDPQALPLKKVFAPGLVLDVSPPEEVGEGLDATAIGPADANAFRTGVAQALYDAIFDWFLEAYVGGNASAPRSLASAEGAEMTTSSTAPDEGTSLPPSSPFQDPSFIQGLREAVLDAPDEGQAPERPEPNTLPPEGMSP